MRQLVDTTSGTTQLFFTNHVSNRRVCDWLNRNLDHLNLNEAHSAKATFENGQFLVSGDEDFRTLELQIVETVNVNS